MPTTGTASTVETLCEVMHDAYEAAAVTAGWETQERSRKPWAEVPEANKATMRAAVTAVLDALPAIGWVHFYGVIEEHVEWGCQSPNTQEIFRESREPEDEYLNGWPKVSRTVRTVTAPDGTITTTKGPWTVARG
ncbi:hypothetical protein [Kineosporia sp. R_H_3]|uniref:hypothetical protein n=1 Tax=Kineosporia sp. R_H_3 TaxID=1961848 RepID=UPI000B4AAB9B|nr:hypothetical protein [Kineosporia sp. R_H_3]